MILSRRKTLAVLGGGVILAAGTAGGAFLTTRTPERALAPWATAGSRYRDPRMRALSYAILAPNPHNLQPWTVSLPGEDRVRLYHDPQRRLPETDPFDRQIVIGLGCFLAQMEVAASADGYTIETVLYPDGEGKDSAVAETRFVAGGTPDPLAAQLLDRRSCKEPFDMARPVAAERLAALRAVAVPEAPVDGAVQGPMVQDLRELIWEAWEIEALTPRTLAESVDLLRVGRREIEAAPDGIDLQSPMLEVMRRIGLLERASLMDTEGAGFQGTMETYRTMFAATPAFVWVTTPGNTRADQIAAGRSWLRLNLAATGLGLAAHPVSQALQEYPEMAGHYARAHDLLGRPGETVQMLGRLGYGPTVAPTPRWPLEAKLRNA